MLFNSTLQSIRAHLGRYMKCTRMRHLLYDIFCFQLILSKMKNPVNIEVYGVLVYFETLKVLEAGIEPAHPKILDFESSASTNSATRAFGGSKL